MLFSRIASGPWLSLCWRMTPCYVCLFIRAWIGLIVGLDKDQITFYCVLEREVFQQKRACSLSAVITAYSIPGICCLVIKDRLPKFTGVWQRFQLTSSVHFIVCFFTECSLEQHCSKINFNFYKVFLNFKCIFVLRW